ncbi:hypothetical protein MMC19_000111 [Ptychographa xylographoides]|nr:hypothetical protein [Ptychographa xylographoides]
MSLSVKHLNGDTTFLLTFSASKSSHPLTASSTTVGSFTVLLDPWLSGDSTIYHPMFALAKHTVPSCIDHLSEIPPPNVVVISQDKPDHCHEATLRQLDPSLRHTIILAESGAAKKIRNWKYFNPAKIHSFPPYSAKRPQSVVRFHIPSPVLGGAQGEATIVFVPTKRDVTGLHNAICFTYRPPGPTAASEPPLKSFYNGRPSSTSQLVARDQSSFSSQPTSPDWPIPSDMSVSPARPISVQPLGPSAWPCVSERPTSFRRRTSSNLDLPFQGSPFLETLPPTPPESPNSRSNFSSPSLSPQPDSFFAHTTTSSISSALSIPAFSTYPSTLSTSAPSQTNAFPPTSPFRPKTLSVIYSPHGITYPALIPYITTHLISAAALPLTLLLHSFDRVQNPWYLGGNISAGMPGGSEIAQKLMARCWVGAHDEEKVSSGISVKKCITRRYRVEEVRELVGKAVDVRVLDCGEDMLISI